MASELSRTLSIPLEEAEDKLLNLSPFETKVCYYPFIPVRISVLKVKLFYFTMKLIKSTRTLFLQNLVTRIELFFFFRICCITLCLDKSTGYRYLDLLFTIKIKQGGAAVIQISLKQTVVISTWPQSPPFPQKLATALKNMICTLHSTLHMYDRCLTINSVCILMFIVGIHLCFVEYTYS